MNYLKLDIQLFADGKVVIETDLDNKGFKSGLDKMQSIAKTGFKAVASSVGVVSTAMAGLIGFGVNYNAEIEQLQTSFEVMTGSAEKAKDVIAELTKLGAETPFETKDLAKVTQLLMNYGLTANDAIDKMKMLGDIAQGSAEKMDRIAMAYGQMSSAGKVQLEDIKQMIEAGFNPLQEISQTTGESMASLYDRISKGTISVDEITASMKRSTSVGGKYFQSMEKQSKTLSGQISTLKDNFSQFAGVISKDTTNAISNDFLPAINDMIGEMQSAFSEDGIKGMAEAFGEGITNLLLMIVERTPEIAETAILVIQSFIQGIQDNLPMITQSAVSIMSTLINGILLTLPTILQMGIDIITELINGIAEQAPILIPQIVDTILNLFLTLTDPNNLDKLIDAGIKLVLALIEGIINSIPVLLSDTDRLLQVMVTVLSGGQALLGKVGWALIKALISALGDMLSPLGEKAKELLNKIVNKIKEGVTSLKNVGKNLIEGLWNGMLNAKDWLLNKVKSFAKSIIKKIKDTLGIASPSKVMRDEVGKFMPQGIEVGFEKELPKVYDDMQRAIDLETEKMNASVKTGNVYNRIMNTTPIQVNGSYTSILEVDREVLAEVVNDVNDKKDLQYQF